MIDPSLAVSASILAELKELHKEQAGTEAMVRYLREQNLSPGRARLALACSGIITLGEAKSAVHFSAAYLDGRSEREQFEQAAFDAADTTSQHRSDLAA